MSVETEFSVPASKVELTIVMPCLNEAETLATCIGKAQFGLDRAGVTGEIVVADNGSTDDSPAIAEKNGARVVFVKEKGYGSALRGGIAAAQGKWIIMGDADDSYDFSQITGFVNKFREGFELVMGCRLPVGGGTIVPGAMPWKNRRIGNPVLTFIGRLFFKCPAHDFHCGLRGFTKAAFEKMDLQTTGMEFASEMVIKATLKRLKIAEVPITLHKDGRSRPPHLKPWRDGWRHLRFMLLYSPRWLFFYPGLVLVLFGLLGYVVALPGLYIGQINFDVHTLLFSSLAILLGYQAISFAVLVKTFAIFEKLLPEDIKVNRLNKVASLERGILVGAVVMLAGLFLLAVAVRQWQSVGFGHLDYSRTMRWVIPGVTLCSLGFQTVLSAFFVGILGLARK